MANQNVEFQKLTPTKNFNLGNYEDALNFVFENNDIKNIAITGPYGAGKTSLIETYKDKYSDKNYINISLAHFKSEGNESDSYETNIHENILEGKILNQLIHQIDSKKIPKTNFKVKQKVSRKKIAIDTVLLIFFMVLVLFIFFFEAWGNYISNLPLDWLKERLMWTTNQELILLSGILSILLLGRAIYSVIIVQNNRNIFKKLNLQGNEIEIFEESKESYFDKYLNEVLYIFENSDAHAIIFEDIDRYNVSLIFEKLREINTLINNKRIRKKEEPIRFIFLLRDDVFMSKDRTKFFDFIIPVIPVIDSSNSFEQFLEHFKSGNIASMFDTKFLQGLSLYIDDMRMLKNVYNEFLIYKNRLSSIELNPNKLLAIIAYKNIFPKDFSDLQLSSGYVYTLFNKKNEFGSEQVRIYDTKIAEKENLIEKIDKETYESIEELESAYLTIKYSLNTVNGKPVSSFDSGTKLLKEIKKNPTNNQGLQNGYWTNINLQTELEKLNENPEYAERKILIESKSNSKLETINQDIRDLKRKKSEINRRKLKEIITKENIDGIFGVTYTNEIGEENGFEEIKGSTYYPLIKYLIRNGYIDETYADYMTYFYENSLSISDKIFLRSISDQVAKEYTYSLNNPELIMTRLNVLDFNNEEILNFDLLCFLLKNKNVYKVFLNKFIQQLKGTQNFQFIEEFYAKNNEINSFINMINVNWPSMFEDIIDESNFDNVLIKQFAIYLLYYSSEDDLSNQNRNGYLTGFISNSASFLSIDDPKVEKLIDGFTKLNIKFNEINYDDANKDLLDAVYKNHLYKLNYDLIALILEKKYELPRDDNFKYKNYTLISSDKEQNLFKYINENIEIYFNTILENCDEKILDDEHAALELINDSRINYDDKIIYFQYFKTRISNIDDINDKSLWKIVIEKELVLYNEKNILKYYFNNEKEIDSVLVQFINSSTSLIEFNMEYITEIYDEDTGHAIFESLINCNDMSNDRYETILPTFNLFYNSFSFEGVAEEKIKILINKKIIRMSKENLNFIREYFEDSLLEFIVINIEKYVELIEEDSFSINETIIMLDQPVDELYKIKLLNLTSEKISLIGKNYSKTIKTHILNNNFDNSDMPYLVRSYSNEHKEIKLIIERLIIDDFEKIIEEEIQIPYLLFKEILKSNELITEVKKEIFAISLSLFNLSQTIELIGILDLEEYEGLFNRKRPKITATEIDKKILTIFKQKGWITKFEEDEHSGYYRAYGRSLVDI